MARSVIYCYTNLINDKKYVGQSNNFERRVREHKSCSFNPKSVNYNDLIHRAIRKYGYENFKIEILETLEEGAPAETVNNREAFWIKEKKSLISEHGYNILESGTDSGWHSVFSKEQIQDIKNMIKSKNPYDDIVKKYGISKTFISNINSGMYFFDDNETYPLCPYRIENDTYDLLIQDLEKPELTFKALAEKYDLAESTVKKFNYGKLRPGYYDGEYPIRKITPSVYRANKIIDYLLNTSLSKKEIVQLTKSSDETVRKINLGLMHHREDLTYPLRQ